MTASGESTEQSTVPDPAEFAVVVTATLKEFLEVVRDELKADRAESVLTLIDRLLDSGGGRTRPYLCYLGYRLAGGGHDDRILRVGGSLELFHTFALLHDDVIDEAQTRRGVSLSTFGDETGDKAAMILAGDLAFALSDRLFWSSGFSPEVLMKAMPILSEMRSRTAAGQFLEIVYSGQIADPREARSIAKLKTASYTFEGPLALGATLAGAEPEFIENVRKLGRIAGEAFQLRDDLQLMDGENDDLVLGRPSTLIAEAGQRVGVEERDVILLAMGGGTNGSVAAALDVISRSGAVELIRSEVASLSSQAVDALQTLSPSGEPKAISRLKEIAVWISESG